MFSIFPLSLNARITGWSAFLATTVFVLFERLSPQQVLVPALLSVTIGIACAAIAFAASHGHASPTAPSSSSSSPVLETVMAGTAALLVKTISISIPSTHGTEELVLNWIMFVWATILCLDVAMTRSQTPKYNTPNS